MISPPDDIVVKFRMSKTSRKDGRKELLEMVDLAGRAA